MQSSLHIPLSSQTIDDEMQKLESLKQRKITSKSVVDDKEGEINEVRKRAALQAKEIVGYQKAVTALETKLEQKRADRHSLLKACKVRCSWCCAARSFCLRGDLLSDMRKQSNCSCFCVMSSGGKVDFGTFFCSDTLFSIQIDVTRFYRFQMSQVQSNLLMIQQFVKPLF